VKAPAQMAGGVRPHSTGGRVAGQGNARRNRRSWAESPRASSSGLKASVHRPLRAGTTMRRAAGRGYRLIHDLRRCKPRFGEVFHRSSTDRPHETTGEGGHQRWAPGGRRRPARPTAGEGDGRSATPAPRGSTRPLGSLARDRDRTQETTPPRGDAHLLSDPSPGRGRPGGRRAPPPSRGRGSPAGTTKRPKEPIGPPIRFRRCKHRRLGSVRPRSVVDTADASTGDAAFGPSWPLRAETTMAPRARSR
jgi:hypothetical protein